MSTTLPAPLQPTQPQPIGKPAQLDRDAALRRFNLFFVYLPVAILLIVVLLLMGFLAWLTIGGGGDETSRSTVSGVADLFTILFVLPITLLCAILPLGFTGLLIYGRRQQWAPLRWLQRTLWKAEDTVVAVRLKTEAITPKVARPIISLHAIVAYIKTFLTYLKRILTWS
jgi:hypothetical protein